MIRFASFLGVFVLAVLLLAAPVLSTQIILKSPQEMGASSSLVVLGKVSNVRSYWNETRTKSIYNVEGKLVTTLADETRSAGAHKVVWSGTDARGRQVSSGVYFYRLRMGKRILTRKLIMLR